MTKENKRKNELPAYTRGEEIFNMVTHIVGAAMGLAALVLCVLRAVRRGNPAGVWTGAVFGGSMIVLYTMSSIYHGVHRGKAKQVLRVLDHCTIYLLIAGTYTPLLICAVRSVSPILCWINFAVVWGLMIIGTTLTAIDLNRFQPFAMVCYIGMGWSILASARAAMQALGTLGFALLLAGGIWYTAGVAFYAAGKKKRYCHSVFHLFILFGSLMHILCVLFFVL